MARLLASTCGTSLFTGKFAKAPAYVRELFTVHANRREDAFDAPEERLLVDRHIAEVAARLRAASRIEAAEATAELHGILSFYEPEWPRAALQDTLVLLHTDTHIGARAAAAVQSWLEGQGVHAGLECMSGLTAASSDEFSSGMARVIEWCQEASRDWREPGGTVVYNLSGGFKCWQGYMSALGMLYADELVYIFEKGDDLVRIPRLPLSLDLTRVERHLQVLRRMDIADVPAESVAGLPEALVSVRGGHATLSLLGMTLLGECRERVYACRLLESPHDLLRIAPRVREDAARWERSRHMKEINSRLDQLASYLARGQKAMPVGLDLKKLKEDPFPLSTHEFDLWHDGDPWRGFGHYDGPRFVVDRMGAPLHQKG